MLRSSTSDRVHKRSRLVQSAVAAVAAAMGGAAGADQVPVSTIALIGGSDGGGLTIESFESSVGFALNEAGFVSFYAQVSGPGVSTVTANGRNDQVGYLWNGAGLSQFIRRDDEAATAPYEVGNPAPRFGDTSNSGTVSGFIGSASMGLDDSGAVSVKAKVRGATGGNEGLFYGSSSGSMVKLAFLGEDVAASTGITNARWSDLNFDLAANNGQVVFYAGMQSKDPTPVSLGNGYFRGSSAANLVTIARTGDAAGTYGTLLNLGGGGTGRLQSFVSGGRSINSAGETLLIGDLIQGGAITASNNTVVFRGSSEANLQVMAREGAGSPIGGGVNFATFSATGADRAITDNGYLYFKGTVAGTGVNTTGGNDNNDAVFATDPNGALRLLARENQQIPNSPTTGLPSGATHLRFSNTNFTGFRLSESGWIAFANQARADNATSSTGNFNYDGLFIGRAKADGTTELRKIALENDPSSYSQAAFGIERGTFGDPAATWDFASSAADGTAINSRGEVAFSARSGGVDGLYYYDPLVNRTFKVLSEGDTIDVDGPTGPATPQQITTLTSLSAFGGSDTGEPNVFNDARQLLVRATLADGTSGLFVTDVDDALVDISIWAQAGGGTWSPDANWITASPDAPERLAEFGTAITAPSTVNVDGGRTVGELFFNNANAYTISGDTVTIATDGAKRGRIGVRTGSHTIQSGLIFSEDTSVITDAGTGLAITGDISGDGQFRKGGTGTVTLSGNNTYTGDTWVREGNVQVAGDTSLGSATSKLILDGGNIVVTETATIGRAVVVSGDSAGTSGSLQSGIGVAGGKTATFNGAISHQGGADAARGFLYKRGAGKLILTPTGSIRGLRATEGETEIAGSGLSIQLGSTNVSGGANLVVSGTLMSSGSLSLVDATTSVPAGAATISGSATFTSFSPGKGSTLSVPVGGTLTTTSTSSSIVSGTLQADGTLAMAGGLTADSDGTINIGGTATVGGNVSTNKAVNVLAGGTLNATGGLRHLASGTSLIAGTATFGDTIEIDSDANSETQTATISGTASSTGVLLNADTSSSNITVGGTLGVTGSLTTGPITLQSQRTSNATPANLLSGNLTLNVGGAGAVSAGNVTFDALERATATTNLPTDTIRVNQNLTVDGQMTVNRLLQLSRLQTGTTAATIVTMSEPTLGTVNVAVAGTLNSRSSASGGGTSVLRKMPAFTGSGEWDLGDNSLAINFVTGDANQEPAVRTALTSGYAGGEWNGNGLTSLAAFNDPSNRSALGYALATEVGDLDFSTTPTAAWRGVTVDPTSVLVRYTLYGDTDLDGGVAFDDLGRLLNNYNQPTARWSAGDFNYDGTVGFADLGLLLNSYNQAVGGTITSTTLDGEAVALLAEHGFNVVPEPTSVGTIALATLTFLGRRRRTRSLI